MNFERKIEELKILLPEAKPPVGSYVATKISGNQIYISGQISIDENGNLIKGKLGKELDIKKGYEAANIPYTEQMIANEWVLHGKKKSKEQIIKYKEENNLWATIHF